MFKRIKSIKGMGVYRDFTPPAGTSDFNLSNVIFGWNYSGKTTLSRLFSHMERGGYSPGFSGYNFKIEAEDGILDEASAASDRKIVRVFNGDFVNENINFSSASGRPILLLGADSELAEKSIAKIDVALQAIVQAGAKQQNISDKGTSKLAEEKRVTAQHIKATLNLVAAYTAVHLDADIKSAREVDAAYLEDDRLSELISLARTRDDEALPSLQNFRFTKDFLSHYIKVSDLVARSPNLNNVIEILKDDAELSSWVEHGLGFHQPDGDCKFCGNNLPAERLKKLHLHFSQSRVSLRNDLLDLLEKVKSCRVNPALIDRKSVYPQFRAAVGPIMEQMTIACANYNSYIEGLERTLQQKIKDPFAIVLYFSQPNQVSAILEAVNHVFLVVNQLIDEHNKVAGDFLKERAQAISLVRAHFAREFDGANNVLWRERFKDRLARRAEIFRKFSDKNIAEKLRLEAQIDRSQKGREQINLCIESLLGAESVQIRSIKERGESRFILERRDGTLAKTLSEGEKTAIGFSFFLTKLKEEPDLSKVIVFIDDPISSLDANHIFQIAATVRDEFYQKVINAEGVPSWQLKCKQIFFSTHNFEFFNLLRDLPFGKKKSSFYFVRRVSAADSIFGDMPLSLLRNSSEYHYLFSILEDFNNSSDKTNFSVLMHLPNAVRRFLELYTYAKYPAGTVDQRAETLFGVRQGRRILKVLHHFSHGNNIERIQRNSELMADIEVAVSELINWMKVEDGHHLEGLRSVAG